MTDTVPQLTEAHWRAAADAVTGQPSEAWQVAAVARAIAAAEARAKTALPIASELAYRLADDAIGLFLEFRDRHGHDEPAARAAARSEVADGASAELLSDPGPRFSFAARITSAIGPGTVHAEVQIFAGPDSEHRALCGAVTMLPDEAQALVAQLGEARP